MGQFRGDEEKRGGEANTAGSLLDCCEWNGASL